MERSRPDQSEKDDAKSEAKIVLINSRSNEMAKDFRGELAKYAHKTSFCQRLMAILVFMVAMKFWLRVVRILQRDEQGRINLDRLQTRTAVSRDNKA